MTALLPRILLGTIALVALAVPVNAFSLKKALRDVGKVITDAPKIVRSIPSPLNTQIDIITGKTKPQNIIQNEGQRLRDLSQHVRQIDRAIQGPIGDAAQAVGGNFGRILVEFSTGQNSLQKEFLLTATDTTGLVMQGQDPLLAVATPLAAALRDARARYHTTAKPLPEDFRKLFAPFIPPAILARARYSVDNLKITLPSLINSGQKLFGNDHAVVVDDIIVFNKMPNPNDISDIRWVAHEIHHVYQYANWGVEQFALNYSRNYSRVEGETDQVADTIFSLVMNAGGALASSVPSHMPRATFAQAKTIATPLGATRIMVPAQSSSPTGHTVTDRCVVMGEQVVINSSHAVISPMRFYQTVAQRVAPAFPGCVFELVNPVSRFCVSRANGAVFSPNIAFPVGSCQSCNSGNC